MNVSAPSLIEDQHPHESQSMNEEFLRLSTRNHEMTEQNQMLEHRLIQFKAANDEISMQRLQEKKIYETWISILLKEKQFLENELVKSAEYIKWMS